MSRHKKEESETKQTETVILPNIPKNLTPGLETDLEPKGIMDSNLVTKEIEPTVGTIDSKGVVAELASVLGITEINVYPDKLELVEAKVGADLLKDGKPPFLMIFEADGECAIQLAIELPDGTGAESNIQVHKVMHDTWGNELKKFKIASRGYSGCICAPAKRILKCNAKKIYLIY